MCQYLVLSVPTPAPDQYCVHTCVAFFRAARVGHLLTIVSSKTLVFNKSFALILSFTGVPSN